MLAAKKAEFYAAPGLLKNQGLRHFHFEYQSNTLVNKIYVIACSIFAMVFTFGRSVSINMAKLQQIKSLKLQIELCKESDAIRKDILKNPDAVIDVTKPLDATTASSLFVVLTQRYKVSQLRDLIRLHKSKINNPQIALRQLFQSRFEGTGQQAYHRMLIARSIFENFSIDNAYDKQRLVALMAEWGGDSYLPLAIEYIFSKDSSWITSHWLGQSLANIINTESQVGYELPRKDFISYLFSLDVAISTDDLHSMLADATRSCDLVIVKLILDKASKHGQNLNFRTARQLASYSSNEHFKESFLKLASGI